jgi:hypothetical protein
MWVNVGEMVVNGRRCGVVRVCVGYKRRRLRRMSSAGGTGKSDYELAVHEEMMDSIMKGVCDKSRWDLWKEIKPNA